MPFVPSSPPSQRQAFAERLFHQLKSPAARASLMSVREAFAKAYGHPNAHALEQALKKYRAFHSPLSVIGLTPVDACDLVPFLGIKPDRVLDWASRSWKKHQAILNHHPFSIDQVQHLLSSLWGHLDWTHVMQAVSSGPSVPGDNFWQAPAFDGLLAMRQSGRSKSSNFNAVHWVLGKTTNNQHWVGMSGSQALTHTLAIGDDEQWQQQLAIQMGVHRINSGDGALLLDASGQDTLHDAVINACTQSGRTCRVIDWRQRIDGIPPISSMNANAIAKLTFHLLSRPEDGLATRYHINAWSVHVVKHIALKSSHFPALPLTWRHIGNPQDNALWWTTGVGADDDGDCFLEEAQQLFDAIPDAKNRLPALDALDIDHSNVLPSLFNDLRAQVTLVRLPHPRVNQNLWHAGTGVIGAHLTTLLGQSLGHELMTDDNMFDPPLAPPMLLLTCNASIDFPEIMMAQSRAVGMACVFIVPVMKWDDTTRAVVGNCNTKILAELRNNGLHSFDPLDPKEMALLYRANLLRVIRD